MPSLSNHLLDLKVGSQVDVVKFKDSCLEKTVNGSTHLGLLETFMDNTFQLNSLSQVLTRGREIDHWRVKEIGVSFI